MTLIEALKNGVKVYNLDTGELIYDTEKLGTDYFLSNFKSMCACDEDYELYETTEFDDKLYEEIINLDNPDRRIAGVTTDEIINAAWLSSQQCIYDELTEDIEDEFILYEDNHRYKICFKDLDYTFETECIIDLL